MLTLNADAHPLMSRMHKPDPKLGPDEKDKRSVVAIEINEVDQWLFGTVDQAAGLVRVLRVEVFAAGPMQWGGLERQVDWLAQRAALD